MQPQTTRYSGAVIGHYNTMAAPQPTLAAAPAMVAAAPTVITRQFPQGAIYAAAPPQTMVVGQPQAAVSSTVIRQAPATRVVLSSAAAAPAYVAAPSAPATTKVYRAPQTSVISLSGSTASVAAHTQSAQTMRPHTLAGPGYTQGAYEAKHHDDPQLQNLKELRRTSGLKHVPVNDGLSTLKSGAEDGKLSRDQFLASYEELLQMHSIEAPDESVRNAVFDLFDRDDNNVVDMMELICGISLLCSGSEDDKIHAVFNVFDENGDGYVSMDEMFKFLTSVFKVVLTPNVMGVMNSMGVSVESAEDLASVTALECFKTADLNHDGKLSVGEFKNWFYAPRNDPSFLFSPVRKLLQ